MGIYLNPKNKGFAESIHSEIYVDKSGLIACTSKCINSKEKYICVSRPRRFGKSMALEMLAAYYSRGCDSRELFAGLKIERDRTYEEEIAGEFENAMSVGGWSEVMRVLKASEKLLADTLCCDAKSVAEGHNRAHMEVATILTYNDENSCSLPDEFFGKDMAAIGLAYYSARKDYRIIRELPTGRGFADVVFLPLPTAGKPALVIELKYGKSVQTALQQIKDRRYTQALEGYAGEILLVGISYDKDNKNKPHSCVIEKMMYGADR